MVPPLHPTSDESERSAPLLPSSGIDASSMLDLPYAVDESPLPPPPPIRPPSRPPQRPEAVLPPTFSAPRPFDELPPPPAVFEGRARAAEAPTQTMPAPIDAGRLGGTSPYDDEEEAGEEDLFELVARSAHLPPMVAKGGFDAPHTAARPAATGGPSEAVVDVATGSAAPPYERLVDPFAPGSTEVDPGPAATATGSGSLGSAPPAPAPPRPPATALAFSPDATVSASPLPPRTAPSSPSVTGDDRVPTFATIQPLAPSADPRQLRGPATIISETRVGEGLLVAAAASAVSGLIWWAVVALTQRQLVYLAVLLGAFVGQAALVGGRRGSIGLGIVAGSVTLLSLSAAQYFITRSLAISELGADWPLWEGGQAFYDIIRATFEEDPMTGIFVILAAGIAGFQAGTPGRRAAGSLGQPRPTRAPDKIL